MAATLPAMTAACRPVFRPMEEAVAALRATDTLGIPLGPGQPTSFLHALGERDNFEDLDVFGALLVDLFPFLMKPGVRYRSGFYGPAERILASAGAAIEFVPADFRRFTTILQRLSPRVVCTVAAPPDTDGYMSLSLHVGACFDELRRAIADPDRVLIVEVNEELPRTLGFGDDYPHRIHVDDADFLVEGDRPVIEISDPEPSDVDRTIASLVAGFIDDGATLQTGIGGIPSTIVSLLAEGGGGDYGIHSEMFTTGLMRLHQAGKVTNAHKGIFEGFSVTTFSAGTTELYDWLDCNDLVRFLPVDVVNSPEVISRNKRMVTINGALAVDLYGQVVADTIGERQFSGIGGHEDFVSAPGLEFGDRSLVCLPATAEVDGRSVSRITVVPPEGAVVTTPRHQLDLVVTEFGVAHLSGRTVKERAMSLAGIAHPDFRDGLRERAATMG